MTILCLDKIGHSFGGRRILKGISLSLEAGDCVRLVGTSGLGKSTLLDIAAGWLRPAEGRVSRRGRLAVSYQDDALLPWTDARANLAYALAGQPGTQARIGPWLERFELSPEMRPGAMSGGMCRRLALARAFATEADLTLLDEPFAFLDAAWRQRVAAVIDERAGAGGAVLFTTHQMEETPASTIRTVTIGSAGGLVEA